MNCNPGDLVVVVRPVRMHCPTCWREGKANLLGRIFTVTTLQPDGATWNVEEPGVPVCISFPCGSLIKALMAGIADIYLRPVRDKPGDDEALTWAPSPAATQPENTLA